MATKSKVVTIDDLDLALSKLDIFKPGLSYQETAKLVFAALPTPDVSGDQRTFLANREYQSDYPGNLRYHDDDWDYD